MRKALLAACCFGVVLAFAASAHADTLTFSYTGADLGDYVGFTCPAGTGNCALTGTFTVSVANLSDFENLNDAVGYLDASTTTSIGSDPDVTVTSYSFSDGAETVSSDSPGADQTAVFEFDTDSSGDIIDWVIQLSTATIDFSSEWFTTSDGQGGTFVAGITPTDAVSSNDNGEALAYDGGSMTLETGTTPEPSTWLLLATGLGLLGLMARRRRFN